jgi:ribosomal protein S13
MMKACKIDDRYLAFCFDDDEVEKLCQMIADSILMEAQINAIIDLNIDDELDGWNF